MIDRDVAEYWRENYDLTSILRRDWETLWPKLRGKLHIFVGDMDTFYLNKCARRPTICCSSVQILLMQDSVRRTQNRFRLFCVLSTSDAELCSQKRPALYIYRFSVHRMHDRDWVGS